MEVFSLETTAALLGKSVCTVKRMVKRGDLIAVYPKDGKRGRPNLMITASSYGKYILRLEEKKNGKDS